MIASNLEKTNFNGVYGSDLTELKTALELKGYIPVWASAISNVWEGFLDKEQHYDGTYERGVVNAFYAAMIKSMRELTSARIYVIEEGDTSYKIQEVQLSVFDDKRVNVVVPGSLSIVLSLDMYSFSEKLVEASKGHETFDEEDYFNNTSDLDAFDEFSHKLWEILDGHFYGIFIKRDNYVW